MLDRDRKTPQTGLKHFKWEAIRAAIEKGARSETSRTLEQCLQDVILGCLDGGEHARNSCDWYIS